MSEVETSTTACSEDCVLSVWLYAHREEGRKKKKKKHSYRGKRAAAAIRHLCSANLSGRPKLNSLFWLLGQTFDMWCKATAARRWRVLRTGCFSSGWNKFFQPVSAMEQAKTNRRALARHSQSCCTVRLSGKRKANRCTCQWEARSIYKGYQQPACRHHCQFNYCFAVTEIIHWNYCAVVKHSEACQLVSLRGENSYSAALIKKKVHPIVGRTRSAVLKLPLLPSWVILNASVAEQPLSLCLIAEESVKV